MDIFLLDPAGPQSTQQRIAVGRSADERFDALLEDSRPRVESDDMETQRPAEPQDRERHERNEAPAPGGDSARNEPDADPLPAPRPHHGERASQVAAGERGDRQQPQPTARGGSAEVLADVIRLAVAAQAGPAATVTAAVTEHGATTGDTPMRRALAAAPGLAGKPSPLHNGAPAQNPEPALPRVVPVQRPLVRYAPSPMPPIAKPQGALGAQAMLAAQTAAAGPAETPSKAHGTAPANAAAIRVDTAATNPAAARRAAVTTSAAASQTGNSPGTAPSGLAPFKLPGTSPAAGAEFPGGAGARPLGLLGFAAPSLGLSTPLATGVIAPATQPTAGLPVAAEQVAVQIHKAANAGQDRVNIRLYPADLGRVEVKLEWADDGALRAVISAERSDTLDLLQRDSRALDRALQDAGLKTDSDSLSFDLRSQAERRDKAAEPGTDAPERSGPEDQTDETAAADGAVPHRAHDGVLDLSV